MYFVRGIFLNTLDSNLAAQMDLFLAVIFVFCIGGTVATIVSRYRNGDASIGQAIFQSVKWMPFMVTFFSGLSLHVCTALLAHLTGYNMQWSATEKEARQSTIWAEMPAIFRRFWLTFLLFVPLIAAVILFSTSILPPEWQIVGMGVMLPPLWVSFGHVMFPFLLNPFVISLSY